MKMRFKPTGEIIEIEDYCGQPAVCLSIPPKYQIKGKGEFVLCSDCEMIDESRRSSLHYDQIANFQAVTTDSPAVIELTEKLTKEVMKALSRNGLIIDCEKITLTNNGIDITIPKDLGDVKSITINGIKFIREE